MIWIIVISVVVAITIMIVTLGSKSDRLGEKVAGTQIDGLLRIMSKGHETFQNNKLTYWNIYERGVSISQGTTIIEIPWDSISEINTGSYSQFVNKDKSVIGRAAVGGLLLGDVGAVVGGMSGLQQSQVDVGGDLVVISFTYEGKKTTFGLKATQDLPKFMAAYNRFKNEHDKSAEKFQTAQHEVYLIGEYAAHQVIQDENVDLLNAIKYDKTDDILIVDIDGRNADFNLLLNTDQRTEFSNLLNKVLAWQDKAISAHLNAEKEVGQFTARMRLQYANKEKSTGDLYVTLKYYCWFETYNSELNNNTEAFYHIMLCTPNINITDEDATLPGSILFLTIDSVKSILAFIAEDGIKGAVDQKEQESSRIDSILS